MITLTDHHSPRLLKMHPSRVEPLLRDEVQAGAQLIVDEARFSIIDGAVSGSGHVPSLPGTAPSADTHVLDESIRAGEVTQDLGHTSSYAEATAEYAKYHEGSSATVERPFMGPATQRSRGRIFRSLVDRLRKGRA